jgi:hypothetical protein
MSEAKHDEKKADAKAGEVKKGGGLKKLMPILGPIAAVVVLIGVGAGMGFFLKGLVTPSSIAKAQGMEGPKDPHAAEGEDEHGGGDHGGKKGEPGHSLLHSANELVIDSIVTNVRDSGGKRFVKISPAFWIIPEAASGIGMSGGGHGGGGEPAQETKRILRTRIQEHLKEYSLDELASKGIERKLEKAMRDIAEKELRALLPEIPLTKTIVVKVVPADLAVQ